MRMIFLKATMISLMIAAAGRMQSAEFAATGPRGETKLEPKQFLGAVRVTFDQLPTTMSFDLPWHFCAVSENGLKFAHFAAETYDPRNWGASGADASFEAGMDKEGRYARVWIEHQSPARIVVRVRYALANSKYEIAHEDMETDSPYNDGNGDWGEERFCIYPDGTYTRHMTIHTALAAQSLPFGLFREPPQVVHEFMESVVIGPAGHVPTDDIETNPAISLFRMFASNPGKVYPKGLKQDIAFQLPQGPPDDFGDFRDANIMLIHSRSKYKPFTIGLPYGVKLKPYGWEEDKSYPFATWKGYDEPSIGYISVIGHMLNYWHYRRTSDTLEQIYLHGMTDQEHPQDDILELAWSWIAAPELQVPGEPLSPNGSAGRYNMFTYDQAQKAYIVPRKRTGPEALRFNIDAIYDDEYLDGTMWLVNPAFVIPDWNQSDAVFRFLMDGNTMTPGDDYRFGFESTPTGKNLVLWLDSIIDLNEREEHDVMFQIELSGSVR